MVHLKKYFVIYLFMYHHCNSPKQFAVIEYYSGKKKKKKKPQKPQTNTTKHFQDCRITKIS